jgi:hypothetical protein
MRDHTEVPEDPSIQMRSIRLEFDNPEHNYCTNINGTREEIGNYFRQGPVDVGAHPHENMQPIRRIVFLDQSIVMTL